MNMCCYEKRSSTNTTWPSSSLHIQILVIQEYAQEKIEIMHKRSFECCQHSACKLSTEKKVNNYHTKEKVGTCIQSLFILATRRKAELATAFIFFPNCSSVRPHIWIRILVCQTKNITSRTHSHVTFAFQNNSKLQITENLQQNTDCKLHRELQQCSFFGTQKRGQGKQVLAKMFLSWWLESNKQNNTKKIGITTSEDTKSQNRIKNYSEGKETHCRQIDEWINWDQQVFAW